MDIYISSQDGSEIMTIPVVPDDVGGFKHAYEKEYFDTLKGKLTLKGKRELRTFSLHSFFPVKKVRFYIKLGAEFDGWNYVKFLEKYDGLPIRLVVTDKTKYTYLNMLATYEWEIIKIKRNKDIEYKIDFTEFIDENEQNVIRQL